MLLYSYSQVMHGFSASLTATQLSKLEKLPAHRATYHKSFGKLFTTHTPSTHQAMDQAIADGVDIMSLSLGLKMRNIIYKIQQRFVMSAATKYTFSGRRL
ncbi:subtilisin-like protein protease SBT1.7 [Cinnamomum micranthum f. kanehirae]|uniref:Subtilisin-like protein protease SBT1.7 n=1 Tax=Cinnamomum micranthum f. kanehirae TaxID=337451 RepID=A0A443PZE8_9MAGN|nr:subtilisin-like protein protease SBT1.7 [Cinnamomum micranthum f. kanehirae]